MPDTEKTTEGKDRIFFEGKTGAADTVYAGIFRQAEDSIIVIDRALSVRTLERINTAKPGIPVLIYSDNKPGKTQITRQELREFFQRNPGRRLLIGTIAGKCRDRYIILDSGTSREKVYLLSASLGTADGGPSCIIRMEDTGFVEGLIRELETNAYLVLK